MTKPPDPPYLAEQRFGLATGSFPFASRFTDVAGARIHYVDDLEPAGIKRRPVTADLMAAYRRPLPDPRRRLPSYVFAHSILQSRDFLANCGTALGALTNKPALIVWGDADVAFRGKERERFEAALPHHRTIVLRGAGHYVWEDAPDEIAAALRDWWQ